MQTQTLTQKLTAAIRRLDAAATDFDRFTALEAGRKLLKANRLAVSRKPRHASITCRAELVKIDLDAARFNLQMADLIKMADDLVKDYSY